MCLLGYKESEAIGKNIAMLYTPEDCADGVPGMEMGTALTVGRADDERYHLRRDGTRFYANGEMIALRDSDGILREDHARPDRASPDGKHLRASGENTRRSLEDVAHADKALEARVEARTTDLAKMSERWQDLLRRLVTVKEHEIAHVQAVASENGRSIAVFVRLPYAPVRAS